MSEPMTSSRAPELSASRTGSTNRGVSETTGVAVLIAVTVVATASVGLTVALVIDDDPAAFGAQFSFDHSDDLGQLLIFYSDGEELPAGEVLIVGPDNEVTWAEVDGNRDADDELEPGNVPVQLHSGNAYGASVSADDHFEIRYVPADAEGDAVVLASWNAPDEASDDDLVDVPGE